MTKADPLEIVIVAILALFVLIDAITDHVSPPGPRRDTYARHRAPREIQSWIISHVLRKRKKGDP